jgi:transposase
MKMPIPPIHETPEDLKALLSAEHDAHRHQRLQALYLLQTQQARTRRQVAQLLGVSRDPVGRWLAAYATGGILQMLTIAKAPGKTPLLSPEVQQALRERLAHLDGFASDKAVWQWLRQDYGLSIAYKTVHKFVRYTLQAKLKVPLKSHIKKSRSCGDISGEFFKPPAGETHRRTVSVTTSA